MKTKLVFVICFIYLTLSLPSYAYIDPNTGGMLFSIVLGSITTVFFLFNSLFYKIKEKLFSSKILAKNKHNFVIYNEGKQYWSVFKPILDEFEKRKISLMYFTSAIDDSFFDESYKYIKGEYIGKGNKAYFKLAFLHADVCLLTTPHLDVMQLKRSKNVKHYAHIFHSISFSMNYRLFALDYFDSVLCDAKFQVPIIREIEKKRNLKAKKLPVVGSTYMDFNQKRLKEIEIEDNKEYTILLAPSWGKFSILNKFGELILNDLKDANYKVIIRPHPQSLVVDKKLIDKLMEKTKKYKNIKWDFNPDNLKTLANADILISDFSCIMFDYAFLFNKPFLYLKTDIAFEALDCSDLDEVAWRYKILNDISKELKPQNGDIKNIVSIIDEMKNNLNIIENIKNASSYAWENRGESAKRAVDFLVQTQKELNE
ncbi:MAG: CDP-glycerol glycerophosphotransferase family protein [Candidatus Gastranaerophilales bacterium]|nr:CDP-glycerol glycerophosphotransferase family protein [Candidatus Gastranaerophilales bacterium]